MPRSRNSSNIASQNRRNKIFRNKIIIDTPNTSMHHAVETVPISHHKIIEIKSSSIPLIHLSMPTRFPGLIHTHVKTKKGGGAKLSLWAQ